MAGDIDARLGELGIELPEPWERGRVDGKAGRLVPPSHPLGPATRGRGHLAAQAQPEQAECLVGPVAEIQEGALLGRAQG